MSRTAKAAAGPDDTAAAIAHGRSLEAELATEQVAVAPTVTANEHAARLHSEAASWHRRAANDRRALLHDISAKVHTRVAVRLKSDDDRTEAQ